jgi:transketolase
MTTTDTLEGAPAGGLTHPETHKAMANAIRALSMDAVQKANSGHPGMPMGMADAATVLFTRFLKFDPKNPAWPDRDRFVLSAGHGSMLLYSLLHLTGYEDMTIEEIENFRQLGSKTAGHPEYSHAPGVETTTGPLGQGLGNAVGMAMAERHLNARFGDELVDHFTYVIAGDGCLMEGISQEALSMAGHLKLSKLIVLWDDNDITIDGAVSLSDSTDQLMRFKASGWDVARVDGHDPEAVAAAIATAQKTGTPSLIACKTTIGYGAPTKAGTSATHGAALGEEEIAGTRKALGWAAAPFEIPEDVLGHWRAAGGRGADDFAAWQARHAKSPQATAFDIAIAGEISSDLSGKLNAHKKALSIEAKAAATRKSSGAALQVINETVLETIGGSADLTGSNNTDWKGMEALTADNYGGRFVYYGIREHGMAAAMNGMALHGGVIPYSGTFLVFTDYCRPSIRLSALMGLRVVYVMTHDSIGLGEDGPTHQPVEHLAALRAIPNLAVFRPADSVETAECWELALKRTDGPSVIALTRQNVPVVRTTHTDENLCSQGAYEVIAAEGDAKVTLFATGSEVEVAMDAREALQGEGIPTRVVSVPSWELAGEAWTKDDGTVRIAVEAGVGLGWERFTGAGGGFVGMSSFGASAPAEDLFKHFGITAEAVAQMAKEKLNS